MNPIALYNQSALECSKKITNLYSTSFSLGIKTLHPSIRNSIYGIYGFVRYADEIVDTFHDKNKALLLKEFKAETYKAINEHISFNPVLHSFQLVVNEYNIEHDLIEAFFKSMEMDLENISYNNNIYNEYIYGSAEVVGLMCLRVFCNKNESQYQSLVPSARSLGAAFQKINFLRDIKSDFEDRGRTYFPNVDFKNFTETDKKLIEKDIKKDFDDALVGIKKLPKTSKLGVYLAYVYYIQLFKRIQSTSASLILEKRIRIPDFEKIALLIQSYFKHSLNYI